jgi:integrase
MHSAVSLAEAREAARDARRLVRDGKDPIAERRASRATKAKAKTVEEAGRAHIEARRAGWRNEKSAEQWEQSLATYVYPVIGDMKVGAVEVADVLRVLAPIWTEKPETASRVRNRLELIFDAAKALGWRSGENPARWRGHLDKLLPARAKVARVEHFAAMPYREIAGLMSDLRRQESVAPRALEFAVLTVARTGEALGAQWAVVDLEQRIWVIPAQRSKTAVEHRVPLSGQAVAILREMEAIRVNDFVFPGRRGPLSGVMLRLALKRVGRGDVTVHGMRSAFRDWAGNETRFPRELCEEALAHITSGAVERAYRRGDALEKRRKLMDAWAAYCVRPAAATGAVVQLRA